jgi:two-component system, cell cycle sensor histidine kinase and response regulator CckA
VKTKADAKGRIELRKKAEKQVKESAPGGKAIRRSNMLELNHELQVHQVEIELQNDELRRSRLELENSYMKYFDLYDLAPIGYVTIDRHGLIREINLAGAELLGRDRRRLDGVVFARFVTQSSRDDLHRFFRRLFGSKQRQECQLQLTTKNQSRLDVLLSGITIRDDGSKLSLGQIAITDVTLSKRAEERERLAAVGETAAVLAHEISNPLTAMLLNLRLLERGLIETRKKRLASLVKSISTEVLHLSNLLQDFSRLSRRETYNLQPSSLAVLAQDILAMEAPKYAAKPIRVELKVEPDLPLVLADTGKIKQTLVNLFKNAEEAMPKGGTLILRAYKSEDRVLLEIRDTGIGIPKDLNIEEPFTTTKPSGTGLGLMIVRQIVAHHHGFLSYTSDPGKGTSFFLSFPVATFEHGLEQRVRTARGGSRVRFGGT